MSNMLRKLRREAGTWERRERAAPQSKLNRIRAERRKRQRQPKATVTEQLPLLPPAPPTVLDRLRAVFAPRSSSKGR